MKNKKIIAITVTSLVLGSSVIYASASNLGASKNENFEKGARHNINNTMNGAWSSDYETWKEVISGSNNSDILNIIVSEDDFNKMIEARDLIKEGDREEAELIMEELGLSFRDMGFGRHQHDRRNGNKDNSAEILAIENGDYNAWKDAATERGDSKILSEIENEADFEKLVEAHSLMKNGDREDAKVIFEELGVDFEKGSRGPRGEASEDIKEAIQDKDYETWKVLLGDRGGKILEIIDTEDKFMKFAEAKNLQFEGEHESAKEILDELGFPFKERGFERFSLAR